MPFSENFQAMDIFQTIFLNFYKP